MKKAQLLIAVLVLGVLANCGVESTPIPPKARIGVNVSPDGVNTSASVAFSPFSNLRIQVGI